MEIVNLTLTLQTIGTISPVTYLQRLNIFLQLNGYLNKNDSDNSIAIINSFALFLRNYETRDEYSNRLTQYLLNDNYNTRRNIIYNADFKRILFDHIMSSVVFEKYGNIYGFLGEIYRHEMNNISVWNLLQKVELFFMNTTYNEETFTRIMHGMIIPLFPISNQFINSFDFIYAQAGAILYNNLMRYDYFFDIEEDDAKHPLYEQGQYVFDDCLEIGLAVHQLVISGKIDNSALKIFALPALFNYLRDKRDELADVKMENLVSQSEHWVRAFDLLFDKVNKFLQYGQIFQLLDPKFRYYLELFNYQSRESLAKEEIEKKCELTADDNDDDDKLEKEILKYVTNPNNYSCFGNGGELLLPLDDVYKSRRNKFLKVYYNFAEAIHQERTNKSATITNGQIRINGKTFVDCRNRQTLTSTSNRNTMRKNLQDPIKNRKKPFLINPKYVPKSSKELNSIDSIDPIGKKLLLSKFDKQFSKKDHHLENNYHRELPKGGKNHQNKEEKHCLTLLYACIAGIINGNRINSPSSNCPIRGTIRFQDVMNWEEIRAQFTKFETRVELSKAGISLRTIALANSMRTILGNVSNLGSRGMNEGDENMLNGLGIEKTVIIDVEGILGGDGLQLVDHLIRTIEKEFFVPYLSSSRNFSINSKYLG